MRRLWLGALLAPALTAGPALADGGSAADPSLSGADIAWMITASAMVLFMTPGLSFFYGGMVRAKNMISTMLQSFMCMGLVSLLWVVVGFSLAFGDSVRGLIGNPLTFFLFRGVGEQTHAALAPTIPLILFSMFQLKFAIITPALITGAFAERVRFRGYLLFVCLWSIVVYCPLAHWTWHPGGFLRQMGVLDFAGGTVVHMSAGFSALVAAWVFGHRQDYAPGVAHPPANVPYVLLGTGMLWFGWFGFNAGSALAASPVAVQAIMTTHIASGVAMLTWLVVDWLRKEKPSAVGACVGAVVGLVAITPAAGYVTVGASLVIGAAAGVVCNIAARWRGRSTLDDTLDVFPCHGLGGVVGMLATGLFASRLVNAGGADGLLRGNPALFWHHAVALGVVAAFSLGATYVLLKLCDAVVGIRITESEERIGLDETQHGETWKLAA